MEDRRLEAEKIIQELDPKALQRLRLHREKLHKHLHMKPMEMKMLRLIFAPTTKDSSENLDQVKEIAKVCDSGKIAENSRIVAMSTCKYPDTIDRTVVIAAIQE